jgi:hypothetical protein
VNDAGHARDRRRSSLRAERGESHDNKEEERAMLRLLAALCLALIYIQSPAPLMPLITPLGNYAEYVFAVAIALLTAPTVIAWFD